MAIKGGDTTVTQVVNSSSQSTTFKKLSYCNSFNCLQSTGALMVLLWNMLIAVGYGAIIYNPFEMILNPRNGIIQEVIFNPKNKTLHFSQVLTITLGFYGVLGLLQMLYPIGGLIADVYVGRYKTIMRVYSILG